MKFTMWPAIHHNSGIPASKSPDVVLPKAKEFLQKKPARGDITNIMSVYVADGVTDAVITNAYFSTTYGSWGNGWYNLQDFNDYDWIVVGAPGYYWSSFQGLSGATIRVDLLPEIGG